VGQNEYALKPETERNKTQEKVTNLNQDLTVGICILVSFAIPART
jgi:hypothetical protein